MDTLHLLIEKLNIDPIIVALVILSGFFQEKYLCHFKLSKETRYDAALKTLAVSFIAASIYIVLIYDKTVPLPAAKYFISYFAATSLYDMVIRPVTKWMKKLISKATGEEPEKDQL